MLQGLVTKVRRALRVVVLGLQILRLCGPRIFLRNLTHQLNGHTIFYLITRDLNVPLPSSSFKCTTKLASPDDIDELFRDLHRESPEGRYQLLVRKWYHEHGFGDCYVTRATDTDEICVVQWLVTSEHINKLGWEGRVPLTEKTFLFDNLYTFERYRRQGARTTAGNQMREIALKRGFERTIAYNNLTNLPQRHFYEKTNTEVNAMILERHFLFHVTRRTLEEYNPPIPIAELIDKSNNSISL